MSLTFGILVILCPFSLTRPVFVSYWGNIHVLRGRGKVFENIARRAGEEERKNRYRRKKDQRELRRKRFLYLFSLRLP